MIGRSIALLIAIAVVMFLVEQGLPLWLAIVATALVAILIGSFFAS
jgi:uncharacterized membrane protein AbrB (regulator of aidB expression)